MNNSESKVDVSIIIPVADDVVGLRRTLGSVIASINASTCAAEVIVVNDGSEGAISEVCESFETSEVKLPVNRGSYCARNEGIHASRADILAFLDADQKVELNWLSEGLSAVQNADYVAGNVQITLTPGSGWWERLDRIVAFPVEKMLHTSHFGPTANLFVRKSVFDESGTFDERLRSGGDMEFGDRVMRAGSYRQVYCPNAISYHPARNMRQKIGKIRRVVIGQFDLRAYYPERFGKSGNLLKQLMYLPAPPFRRFIGFTDGKGVPPHEAAVLFFLFWLSQIYTRYFYIRLRLRPHAPPVPNERPIDEGSSSKRMI